MSKENFYAAIKALLAVAAVISGIVLTFVLADNPQRNGILSPASHSTGIVAIICAIILFLLVLFLLRLTRVNWFWSILGGAASIVLYSLFVNSLINLLSAFIRGWIFG